MIKKVENNVVSDPKGEETFLGGGYKKELQKTNQKELELKE